jgi:hypothetical protein
MGLQNRLHSILPTLRDGRCWVRLLRLQPARHNILVNWVHYRISIEDLALEQFVDRPAQAGTASGRAYKTRGGS